MRHPSCRPEVFHGKYLISYKSTLLDMALAGNERNALCLMYTRDYRLNEKGVAVRGTNLSIAGNHVGHAKVVDVENIPH